MSAASSALFFPGLPGVLALYRVRQMIKPKIWYVSFENPKLTRRQHVRSAQTFESEEEAKQFARDALASFKSVYAGTINPHTPKRFISPDKVDEWLNAV